MLRIVIHLTFNSLYIHIRCSNAMSDVCSPLYLMIIDGFSHSSSLYANNSWSGGGGNTKGNPYRWRRKCSTNLTRITCLVPIIPVPILSTTTKLAMLGTIVPTSLLNLLRYIIQYSISIQSKMKQQPILFSPFLQPLPRPASVSAIHQSNRTHGSSGGASYNYNHYTNYNNFRPQLHDSWKSEWDSSYYDTSNSGTAPRSSKTAPTRPATSYGRYPTYGRSRPSNFHDDF